MNLNIANNKIQHSMKPKEKESLGFLKLTN